ncbi:Sugar transferase [Desulfovibrio sp. DV]|nr:Sugar transferase [Desulfovibrio sp. DV]
MTTETLHLPRKNSLMSLSIIDAVIALLSFHAAFLLINKQSELSQNFYSETMTTYILIVCLPYTLMHLTYTSTQIKMHLRNIILKLLISIALSFILFVTIAEIRPLDQERSTMLVTIGVFALLMLAIETRRNRDDAIPNLIRRVLIVGNGALADDMERLVASGEHAYRVAGRIHYPTNAKTGSNTTPMDLCQTALSLKANKVLISLAERRGVFPLQEMLNCKLSGIEVLDAPTLYERITGKLLIENITPSWFIFCHGFQLSKLLLAAKRFMDFTCALTGILVILPFVPLIVLAIALDSPGPVLFRQVRVGKGDRNFVLYKFRTMRQDAEKKTGAVWASTKDSRVTRIGTFLRKSRIDELPQLINVLRGEMSLVGPRPERPEFVKNLKKIIPYYSERHFVKPGVTGWAQVSYPYGASVEDAIEKLRFDLYYIKNLSISLDIKIILKTVLVVLLQRGGR